MTESLVDFCTL